MAITTTEGLKATYPVLCERLEKEARGETTISIVTVVKDCQGRIDTWTEKTKDLDGVVIGKRVDIYSYYSTGETNEIIQEKYSDTELVSKQKIKHYLNGAQPIVYSMEVKDVKV